MILSYFLKHYSHIFAHKTSSKGPLSFMFTKYIQYNSLSITTSPSDPQILSKLLFIIKQYNNQYQRKAIKQTNYSNARICITSESVECVWLLMIGNEFDAENPSQGWYSSIPENSFSS